MLIRFFLKTSVYRFLLNNLYSIDFVPVDGKKSGQTESDEQREKRRKSRWSNTKAFVPGMPTILPADIDDNQRQIYLRMFYYFIRF